MLLKATSLVASADLHFLENPIPESQSRSGAPMNQPVDSSFGDLASQSPRTSVPVCPPPLQDNADSALTGAADVSPPHASAEEQTRRTLHVINGEDYSGAERVQDLLAMRLPELGYKVAFACVKPDRFANAYEAKATPLYETPMRARFDLRPAWTLARLIRQEGFCLVHAHSPRAALVGSLAARLAGVPLVHHVHGQTAVDTVAWWRKWINAVAERASLSNAGAVIAVSESAAEYMCAQGVAAAKVHVVPNGVPSPPMLPERPRPKKPWVIGCVAMFRPRKGIEVLLDAAARLRDRGCPIRLRMVGRFQFPSYEAQIRQHVKALKLESLVDWVGFTTNVHAELREMDLFVLPSVLAEGLPMAVLEAMAWGVPVIGTRVAGTLDTVRHGHDGVLVDPGSADQLATAIEQFVHGHWNWDSLRREAYNRQVERFSDRSMAQGVAQVYERVLCPQYRSAVTSRAVSSLV